MDRRLVTEFEWSLNTEECSSLKDMINAYWPWQIFGWFNRVRWLISRIFDFQLYFLNSQPESLSARFQWTSTMVSQVKTWIGTKNKKIRFEKRRWFQIRNKGKSCSTMDVKTENPRFPWKIPSKIPKTMVVMISNQALGIKNK